MPIIMPHLFNDTAPSVRGMRGQADAPMYLWSVSKACYGPCWQQVNPVRRCRCGETAQAAMAAMAMAAVGTG